ESWCGPEQLLFKDDPFGIGGTFALNLTEYDNDEDGQYGRIEHLVQEWDIHEDRGIRPSLGSNLEVQRNRNGSDNTPDGGIVGRPLPEKAGEEHGKYARTDHTCKFLDELKCLTQVTQHGCNEDGDYQCHHCGKPPYSHGLFVGSARIKIGSVDIHGEDGGC